MKNNRGFSLAEILIVLAILTILSSLIVPNVVAAHRKLRQRELDAKAELIYIAAQNQIVKLRAAGETDRYRYTDGSHLVPGTPADAMETAELYYMSSAERGIANTPASAVMTTGTVDDALLTKYWVIEYDPANSGVFGVFYSEETNLAADYFSNWSAYDALRVPEKRAVEAKVGYYGGHVSATSTASTLSASLLIYNGEKLTAELNCLAPVGVTDLKFDLVLEDDLGNRQTMTYFASKNELEHVGRKYFKTVTLDDLSSGETRFSETCPELVPGRPLRAWLEVSSEDGEAMPTNSTVTNTNGLFGDGTAIAPDGSVREVCTVGIRCARHLQNLDESSKAFHNSDNVLIKAIQDADISFIDSEDGATDWHDCYAAAFFNGRANGTANFRPIHNGSLVSYDGGNRKIVGLNAHSADADAGLFAYIDGAELRNIFLENRVADACAVSSASGAAAMLTAAAKGECVIENCRVYLDVTGNDKKDEKDLWVSGRNAGGLVGVVSLGSRLTIRDSFASTVLGGYQVLTRLGVAKSSLTAQNAGGLIGYVAANAAVTLSGCYADSYIYGRETGGLVGGAESGAQVTLRDCYAAGFQTASSSAAGLVNGAVASASNSYTICARGVNADAATAYYSTAKSFGDTPTNVYYFLSGTDAGETKSIENMSGRELCDVLGGGFVESGHLYAYNLMSLALDSYNFPHLKAISTHYGDWQASFIEGGLVYFEQYNGRTYAFYGANTDDPALMLHENSVVTGDGYGVVFQSRKPAEVTVALGDGEEDTYTIHPATDPSCTVKGSDGKVYRIYPLPPAALNGAPVKGPDGAPDFYRAATVTVKTTAGSEGVTMPYTFNPHFARTVNVDSRQMLVRSARQLYCLSRYYDAYDNKDRAQSYFGDEKWTFLQECDIDYTAYNWGSFSDKAPEHNAQEPIGKTRELPFRMEYDGGCCRIAGLSFIYGGDFVGMFGVNTGTLHNIVLATDYKLNSTSDSNPFIQRKGGTTQNEQVYIGVLAGLNQSDGDIRNCAVAGYHLAGQFKNEMDGTLRVYDGASLYAGGFVGGNEGRIVNSSTDCPQVNVSTTYATAYVGGFMGWNKTSGTLSNCYAIGYIESAYAKEGNVNIAGFAGLNNGRMSSSYCVVALSASGDAKTYGFAPFGGSGSAENCVYLYRGTYSYVGALRAFLDEAKASSVGTGVELSQLERMRGRGVADFRHAFCHGNTAGGEALPYPYRAVVTDASGKWVHYGDWLNEAALGEHGVFYWESEEDGSNDGVHLTAVGVDGSDIPVALTTLCTAHDDGGVVKSFGYGYYVKKGQENSLTLSSEKIDVSTGSGETAGDRAGKYNQVIAAKLGEQIENYCFYPYTTRLDNPTEGEADQSYVRLTGEAEEGVGTWTLTYNGESYTYQLTPFFANAIQFEKINDKAVEAVKTTASDERAIDYAKAAGSGPEGSGTIPVNPFEIRSVAQLQYLNWNYAGTAPGTAALTNESNYASYPYLMHTKKWGSGQETKASLAGRSYLADKHWMQTHDLDATAEYSQEYRLTPIAAMEFKTFSRSAVPAWFGSHLDGQSYKIKNVRIESDSLTTGLFGVTVGANIKNVILFTDDGAFVKRSTDGSRVSSFRYNIGGLIALAMEYDISPGAAVNTIENCAIAGYDIIDNSVNPGTGGRGNIGGMIGVACVNLERCSAVTDIQINCVHRDHAFQQFGDAIRVGGMAGALRYNATDCYTGGKIEVGRETVEEAFNGNKTVPYTEGMKMADIARNGNAALIYVGGFAGGTASEILANLKGVSTGSGGTSDGNATFTNCYTYLELPKVEGTVKMVSYIASVADRYSNNSSVTLNNCYYLEGIANQETDTPMNKGWYRLVGSGNRNDLIALENYATFVDGMLQGKYKYNNNGSKNIKDQPAAVDEVLMEAYKHGETQIDGYGLGYYKMLMGEANIVKNTMYDDAGNFTQLHQTLFGELPKRVTYEQLSGSKALDSGENILTAINNGYDLQVWHGVTTQERNGADIHGKYSFSSDAAQYGKDFPFPAVVQQNDLTYGTVNNPEWVTVHYGRWTKTGCYWEKGRDSMDIFKDMKLTGNDPEQSYAEKTFRLMNTASDESEQMKEPVLTFSTDGIAKLKGTPTWDAENACFNVTLTALRGGNVVVTATDRSNPEIKASFTLNVTGDLDVGSDPKTLILYATTDPARPWGETLNLYAGGVSETNPHGTYGELGQWTLRSATSDDLYYPLNASGADRYAPVKTVVSQEPGTRMLEAVFEYDYHKDTDPEHEEDHIFRKIAFVTDHTLGLLGLSNGAAYNETWRVPAAETPRPAAADNQAYAAGKEPAFPTEGADFFLYETLSDKSYERMTGGENALSDRDESALGSLIVDSVTLTAHKGSAQTAYTFKPDETGAFAATSATPDAPFTIAVESGVETDDRFQYRAGTLAYTGAAAEKPDSVDVKVDAHFAMGETAADWESYTLRTTVTELSSVRVKFERGVTDGTVTGTMRDRGLPDGGILTLPACGYERPGWHFAGWRLPDGVEWEDVTDGESPAGELETVVRQPDDKVRFELTEGELTLTATWEPNTYTLRLDANGGATPQALPLFENISYGGEAVTLPKIADQLTREGYQFTGWNTEADGLGGRGFADGASVPADLTTQNGAVVTLYAQWQKDYSLALDSSHYSEKMELQPDYGSSDPDGYTAPSWPGWELEGWYTAKDGTGTKVLDAEGNIVAAVDGITSGTPGNYVFRITEKTVTLYARWTGEAYVQASGMKANGVYILLDNANGDGTKYLVDETSAASNKGTYIRRREATVVTGYVESDGEIYTQYVPADSVPDTASWTALPSDNVPNSNPNNPCKEEKEFYLRNGKGKYLAQWNDTLRAFTQGEFDTVVTAGEWPKVVDWAYQSESVMEMQGTAQKGGMPRYVAWSTENSGCYKPTADSTNSPKLYTLQDIYTFD